ncbi:MULTISPECIES: 2-amino-4-hydroxy-6-hydroxymethyldihydropteridine diphosphokinase [Nocardiaceae]|jgi:2-amino-4-hydroxy-6-hydroxymethyldihydropteridine diphosphokinase|uniref:2-amino-4-hydroxy-6- hydroxymethyldihydropteridine diphosphokinase n=1 Tax=Nocardiaceae TaxID=85025 RepID=UPI0005690691|nr:MULTISPECIES: 2-amino-4-hydroxy-6-hydroxymethyldihydropteridine diphosphokinase [Rhodococcus]OZE99278.1 2-amino-4-hydroxy-6-hydroxymethyldihydropteridine diphosphokinase [Rhodococcus sp. 15-1189-1-1a]OZF13569.1 2-amino-4-hydroxy-6-hydroxymethyldihydropteridine diphosphokinase [Rhodococcus sp. 14-2686-1-2]OZF51620.1 2-amino-4-hydroxy-6-hydroxymethyldihydropteridine diphosphokinase [Rhodococcus sp. 14-2470-1b]
MTQVVLSIGSNVGDSLAHLRSVTDDLGPRLRAVSKVYVSAPWGGIEQQDFLNAIVVADDPDRGPYEWLEFAREREANAERVREVRWGPRSLDVDIVVCRSGSGEDVVGTDPQLLLPHPRAHERAFVLVPWLDVEPDATLAVGTDARRVDDWLATLSAEERSGVRATDMAPVSAENPRE